MFPFFFKVLVAVRICSFSYVPCTRQSVLLTSSMSQSSPVRQCASGRSSAVSRWWSVTTTAGPTTWPAASCHSMTVESASLLRPSSRQTDQVHSFICIIAVICVAANFDPRQPNSGNCSYVSVLFCIFVFCFLFVFVSPSQKWCWRWQRLLKNLLKKAQNPKRGGKILSK